MSREAAAGGSRLDRAVDSIAVGSRHRREIGDLTTLRNSIARIGLLCPLTITHDGLLLCGWRRLEAVRQLGWKTVPVFVRRTSAGLRDAIAEHAENTVREPLDVETAAEIYREYKDLEAEQAAERQRATRFRRQTHDDAENRRTNSGGKKGSDGSAASAAPHEQRERPPGQHGDSRAKAAQIVTGTKSYTRLEHMERIKDASSDPNLPAHIRSMAKAARHDVRSNGASAERKWKKIRASIDEHRATDGSGLSDSGQVELADLAAVAEAALAAPRSPGHRGRTKGKPDRGSATRVNTERSLSDVLSDLSSWLDHADLAALAENATSFDLARLHHTTELLDHFCTDVHAALHKRHPVLRRRKRTGARDRAVNDDQPPLWDPPP